MRILLVEDYSDLLEATRLLLTMHRHDVVTATTLRDAVRLCINDSFNLVVCDIGLPDGDGWELAGVARIRNCPAIALTGHTRPADRAKSRQAGFAEHIAKPFGIEELLSAIERAAGPSPQAAGIFAANRDVQQPVFMNHSIQGATMQTNQSDDRKPILKDVTLKDGHSLAIVSRDDGHLGIAFDGKLIPAIRWTPQDVESCVSVFENFVFMHGGACDVPNHASN